MRESTVPSPKAICILVVLLAGAATHCTSKRGVPPPPHMGPLTVAASAEPDRGEAPLTVEFYAETYEGDETRDARYEWDFGDGSPRKLGAKVRHEYRKPGSYTVRVLVTDAYGRRGEDELIVDVE